jgi:HD-GYP domain-containing protein (c-di-GMP phosphodiesterase class II)
LGVSISGWEAGTPDKDQRIRSFLKNLKVMFKTASIYKFDHPAFHQGVTDLKEKLESLFELLSPVAIGFSPSSLLIDGRFWEGERTYIDLGRLFHLRKVKGLVFHHGITLDELTRFAARITLSLTEFIKAGGALQMLKKEHFGHIELDILDYSELLRGEGEEIKDIWPYLLMEAVEEDSPVKLDLVADSFEKIIGKFNTEDLIQNEELQKNFSKFFKYLRETSEEKHRACARGLLKSFLNGKKTATEDKFEKLKLLVSDLSEEDLASTLWEEIIGNEKFDSLSFSIFSKLISKERHKKISTSLRDLFQTDDLANRRADVERKLRAQVRPADVDVAEQLKIKYDSSLQAVANSLNMVLQEEEIDYLDLRFNILGIMEDFMGRHQELLNLISVKDRDLATFAHLLNVSLLSMFFAAKMEFSKDDILDPGVAALYHDVGKLHISLKILQKKTQLAEREVIRMRDHPILGARILDGYEDSLGILPVVVAFEHHIRHDRTGYPKVAYPRQPHLAAMLVSICDVYDALALKRCYKKDYPPDKIYEVMILERGRIFEPALLDRFFQHIGVWPVGSIVSLNDGRVALVRRTNEQDIRRPVVEILFPENGGETVDLLRQPDLSIAAALNPQAEGRDFVPLAKPLPISA